MEVMECTYFQPNVAAQNNYSVQLAIQMRYYGLK